MLKDPILQTKIKTYRDKENRKNKKQNQRFGMFRTLSTYPTNQTQNKIEIQK